MPAGKLDCRKSDVYPDFNVVFNNTAMSKTIIITGGNSGLGFECAKAILQESSEYHLVLACRSKEKSKEAVDQLKKIRSSVEAMDLDLGSLASVRSFAKAFKERADLPPLYAIVCNAGLQFTSNYTETVEGYEATFGVNHLGHFLLVCLLADKLSEPSRIMFVSSGTHDPKEKTGMPEPVYETAELLAHPTTPFSFSVGSLAYSTSKLCNVLCAYELVKRLKGKSISINSYDPGLLPGTGLARDHSAVGQFAWHYILPYMLPVIRYFIPNTHMPYESGTALAHLVISPKYENVTGKYFNLEQEKNSSDLSYDTEKQLDLWRTSVQLAKLEQSETVIPLL